MVLKAFRSGDIRRDILDSLRSAPGTSKIGLARGLGVSPATISNQVRELIEARLVVEAGHDASGGGRPPARLRLNPDWPLMLGIDLGETDARFGVLNLEGRLVDELSQPLRRNSRGVRLEPIVESARGIIHSNAGVAGVGVAVPGLLDGQLGVVRLAANLGWKNVALGPRLFHDLGLPVSIHRNTNVALLAEEWWSPMPVADPLIYLTVGSGIGAAIKVHGEFVSGSGGAAGEVGHIPILSDGPRCACGNLGCLETLASSNALLRRFGELAGAGSGSVESVRRKGKRVGAIATAARRGDPSALQAMAEVGDSLGTGIATLITILNPQLVVIGGELMDAQDLILPRVHEVVRRRALSQYVENARIVASAFGDAASVIGAATAAFDMLFGAGPRATGVAPFRALETTRTRQSQGRVALAMPTEAE